MWEEGACIYDTPGVPNNFPCSDVLVGVSNAITIADSNIVWNIYEWVMWLVIWWNFTSNNNIILKTGLNQSIQLRIGIYSKEPVKN